MNHQDIIILTPQESANRVKVAKKAPKEPQMYDLLWFVGATVMEVPKRNVPIAIAKSTRKTLSTSTHTTGKLVLMKTGSHKF